MSDTGLHNEAARVPGLPEHMMRMHESTEGRTLAHMGLSSVMTYFRLPRRMPRHLPNWSSPEDCDRRNWRQLQMHAEHILRKDRVPSPRASFADTSTMTGLRKLNWTGCESIICRLGGKGWRKHLLSSVGVSSVNRASRNDLPLP